jgi:hypothetical protein
VTEWFVSASGASGNSGAIGSPWDLTSAISGHSGAIKPDDTVWIRGGDYDFTDSGLDCSVVGLLGSGYDCIDGKIIYRAYNPTIAGTNRKDWMTWDPAHGEWRATDIGTGDPSQTERFRIRATEGTAAPTSGALTVNGAHSVNGTTISIAKAAGVDQPVSATSAQGIGHQLVIGTDRYLITASTTIVQGTNTTVSVAAPNAAKSGGESITLILNTSGVDFLLISGSFVWLWDWEGIKILKARTTPAYGGAMFSTFGKVNDGVKFINTTTRDVLGTPFFVEGSSGGIEAYGCTTYNTGGNGVNDGEGHDFYLHHEALWGASIVYEMARKIEDTNGYIQEVTARVTPFQSGATAPTWNTTIGGTTSDNNITWTNRGPVVLEGPNRVSLQARYQANCQLHGYSHLMQLFDTSPVSINKLLWRRNIGINGGQLCTSPNIGGHEGDIYVIGGGTTGAIQELRVRENFGFIADSNIGSRAFHFAEGGGVSGPGNEIAQNYMYVGGWGFGASYYGAFTGIGSVVHKYNTYVTKAPSGGVGNGRCVEIQTAGGAQFDWGGNTYYRALGNNQGCSGVEVGAPEAFSVGGVSACRTFALFQSDTGFKTDRMVLGPPGTCDVFVVDAGKYQKGRGYVIYYNHPSLGSIPADLSPLGIQKGDSFVVHDIRDTLAGMRGQGGSPIIGPITWDGLPISLPNTQLSDTVPSGALQGVGQEVAAPATAPLCNVFLVQRIAARAITHENEQRRFAVGAF